MDNRKSPINIDQIKKAIDLMVPLATEDFIKSGEKGKIYQLSQLLTSKSSIYNEKIAEHICLLASKKLLTEKVLNQLIVDGDFDFDIARSIENGIENLEILKKHGHDLNTEKNREAVVTAGGKAVEASLGIWQMQKKAILADAASSSVMMSRMSMGGNTAVGFKSRELDKIPLHKPLGVSSRPGTPESSPKVPKRK